MTSLPPAGDRGRREVPARVAFGVRPGRFNTALASRTSSGPNGTQANGERCSLTGSGSASGGQLSELLEHLALAMSRHVRHLRQDALQVPPSVDELAVLLVRCVQTRPTATSGDHTWTMESRAVQDDQMAGRLLVSKAEAAELLGVSVRTVERLIAAGQLPLLHIERASRLRVTDIEAYVNSLVAGQANPHRGNHDTPG